MQRVALINGKNKNQDYDLSKIFSSIATSGIVEGLEVQSGKVTPGYAFIEVERNGVIFNVLFENTEDFIIDTTGTKKVFIEINQSNINDGSINLSDGSGIGEIKTALNYPTTNFIGLASITGGVITDSRIFTSFKGLKRKGLNINKILYVNENGEEVELSYDPEIDSGKVILIDALGGLKLESPSVNIGVLEEKTIINENDEFILNRPEEGNKKIGAINLLRANKEVFVAGENITQSDIDNGFNSLGFITNYSSPIKQETGATSYNIGYSTSTTGQGESFTITEPTTIQTIVLKMSRVNSPTGNLSVDIYSNTGTILIGSSTNTIVESSLPLFSTYGLQTFNFNNLVLDPGIYYFKVKTDRANSTSNFSIVQASNTNPYSLGANYEISSTNVWTLISGSDLYFSIGLTTNYSVDKLYKTDATNINKANPICFGVTPANIDENIIGDISGITPYTISSGDIGKPFYLSNTPGAISITPGTNGIKVGKGTTNGILLDLNSNNIGNVVGRAFGTNYLAPSDGFVVGFVYTNGAANVASCYTGVSSPAGTLITKGGSSSVSMYGYFMFPVKKGQYWRVDVSNGTITESLVSFIPNS